MRMISNKYDLEALTDTLLNEAIKLSIGYWEEQYEYKHQDEPNTDKMQFLVYDKDDSIMIDLIKDGEVIHTDNLSEWMNDINE